MLEKKFPQVNSSHDNYRDIVSEINFILKKIKRGAASSSDVLVCETLTNALQGMIKKFTDTDPFDMWVAKETVEMSRYTCKKYGHLAINDKI
jgi:hypothetical protein